MFDGPRFGVHWCAGSTVKAQTQSVKAEWKEWPQSPTALGQYLTAFLQLHEPHCLVQLQKRLGCCQTPLPHLDTGQFSDVALAAVHHCLIHM